MLVGLLVLGLELLYADRSIVAIIAHSIRETFQVDNTQMGALATWFLAGFALAAPIFGYLGDRSRRRWQLALGMGVWGLAAIGCGLAKDFTQLRLARLFVGVGVAGFTVIAPTLLADVFGRDRRTRVMSWYAMAGPIGGFLGMIGARGVAAQFRWSLPFLALGAAGLAMATAFLWLPAPIRGQSEGVDPARLRLHEEVGPSQADYVDMMVNSSVNYSIFAMTFFTFAIGGLSFWLPTFLMAAKGVAPEEVTLKLTIGSFSAAALGIGVGGWGADRWSRTHPRALFLFPAVTMLASVPFLLLAIAGTNPRWIFAGIFAAEALMFVHMGPCLAILANVVAPNMRGVAFAAAFVTAHLLGDFWAPGLMGWVSETFGREDSMMTIFGRMFAAVGAVPTLRPGQSPENLTAGMLVVVPAVVLSGLMLLSGARHLPREMALMLAKLRANPRASARPGSR